MHSTNTLALVECLTEGWSAVAILKTFNMLMETDLAAHQAVLYQQQQALQCLLQQQKFLEMLNTGGTIYDSAMHPTDMYLIVLKIRAKRVHSGHSFYFRSSRSRRIFRICNRFCPNFPSNRHNSMCLPARV